MKTRTIQVALGTVVGIMVALVFTFRDVVPGLGPGPGAAPPDLLLEAPYPAPPLALVDPGGRPISLSELRGSVVAVFFGYTHCPDVCPITLARLGRFQEGLDSAPVPLRVVFVSVDPERDTPERLREFARGLPGSILALTGEGEEVRRQAFEWGVLVRRRDDVDLPAGEYLVDHTARTFVVDPHGQVVATLPPLAEAAEVDRTLGAVLDALD